MVLHHRDFWTPHPNPIDLLEVSRGQGNIFCTDSMGIVCPYSLVLQPFRLEPQTSQEASPKLTPSHTTTTPIQGFGEL